ncbi:hypothetical protein V1520DRAFT_393786 [Lipomyces starkeyi]
MDSSPDNYAFNSTQILHRLKSSAVFVKSPYATEFLLSDALSTKYEVHMNSDAPLLSYSYHRSPYKSSVPIPTTGTPEENRKIRSWPAILMAGYSLNSIFLGCRALKRRRLLFFPVLTFFLTFLFVDISMKKLFKGNDAEYATIYFNNDVEHWVTSLKVFFSSKIMDVSIKWVPVVQASAFGSIAFLVSIALPCVGISAMISDSERAGSKAIVSDLASLLYIAIACLALVYTTRTTLRMIRRSVATVEVQLAQAEGDMVIQLFTNDIAKSGEKRISSADNFIITGPDGGLVYGRLGAKGSSNNV